MQLLNCVDHRLESDADIEQCAAQVVSPEASQLFILTDDDVDSLI